MDREKRDLVRFRAYQVAVVVLAVLAVILVDVSWRERFLSHDPFFLVVLLVSAVVMEALPIRWSVAEYTTLTPMVLLLALLLTGDPVPAVVVSATGAFFGYGAYSVWREIRAPSRQTLLRTILKAVFYAAQSGLSATVVGILYAFLADLVPAGISLGFALEVAMACGWVVVWILASWFLVLVHNRLTSLLWPSDAPLPTPKLPIFLVTAIAPVITALFYRVIPSSTNVVVTWLKPEGVEILIMLVFWPLILAIFGMAARYVAVSLESEQREEIVARFSRYTESILDMAVVTRSVIEEMVAEFECDECVIYSWGDRRRAYELEGGLVGGQMALRTSAEQIPDIGWPKTVEPEGNLLGETVEQGTLGFLHDRGARDLLNRLGLFGTRWRSALIMPLTYAREGGGEEGRIGFIVLARSEETFAYVDRMCAADRLRSQTYAHIALRQARLYRDAQQFFVSVDSGVSRSGEAMLATQALFAKGIDPAKFIGGVSSVVQTYSLTQVVRSIAEGHSPEREVNAFDDDWIESLYTQVRREDKSLPVLSEDIKGYLRTFISTLSVLFRIPYRWPTPEYGGITSQMRDLYSLFLSALEADTIDEILSFGYKLDDEETLEGLKDDFPEAVKELSSLRDVIRTVRLSQELGCDVPTQVDHLSVAVQKLELAREQEPSSSEQVVLARIQRSWTTVISNKREELLSPSDLVLELETQAVVVVGDVVELALCVHNRGMTRATDIRIFISSSDEYEILDPVETSKSTMDRLEPHQDRSLTFKVRPKREGFVRVAFQATWDDQLRAGRTVSYADRVILRPEAAAFVPIENPYVPGPPLRPGSGLFYGREDAFEFVREHIGSGEQHNVLILTGQRRTGKTSLALRLSQQVDPERHVVVYMDGQALGTETGAHLFLRELSVMICDGLEDYGIRCEPLSLTHPGRSAAEEFEHEFLPAALSAIGERSLALVFDEFEELEICVEQAKVDASIFRFLRHLMQHVAHLAFVFVGTHRLQELNQDYWSIFFNLALHKEIGFLDGKAAQRLITEPTRQEVFDPLAVQQILQLTAGHPYLVQLFCHYLVGLRNRSRLAVVTVQHVLDAVHDVLIQADGYLTHLWRMASPLEQMVIASAARVLVGKDYVQAHDVVQQLEIYQLAQAVQDVLLVEEGLARQGILRRLDGNPPRYVFRVALIQRWIERNQPLSLVLASLSEGRAGS
jgi:hypothetical protein